MVSFQCEGCGDVLTKKKLDPHRGQCSNASYSCLDCMVHFRGVEYRSHTACISEDQKYQGDLYKPKATKAKKPAAQPPRHAYIEDAPDVDTGNTVAVVEVLPEAPQPPSPVIRSDPNPILDRIAATTPAQPRPNINKFDYPVNEETPGTSQTRKGQEAKSRRGMEYTPSVLGSDVSRKNSAVETDPEYEKNGFSYGAEPIPATGRKNRPKVEYFTPSAKDLEQDLKEAMRKNKRADKTMSTDKKRKRHDNDERIANYAREPDSEDVIMSDAGGPPVLHSGLTGGLNRLLTKSHYSPPDTPSQSNGHEGSLDPVKRSKHRSSTLTEDQIKASTLIKHRPRHGSDDSANDLPHPRKKTHRSTSISHTQSSGPKQHAMIKRDTGLEMAQAQSQQNYHTRAEFFLSFITKGEESLSGMSMHKALKRYRRDQRDGGSKSRSAYTQQREEEEKELFKRLRLKRNDRGEVVLFL